MRFRNTETKQVAIDSRPWRSIRFDGNTFASVMEPGAQATKYPTPLPIINRLNGVMNINYMGAANNADNTVAIATLRQDGPLWHDFDVGQLPLAVHYLGLGIDDGNSGNASHNDAYNIQFRDSMIESISAAYATQLTQLAFMENKIETNVPYLRGSGSDKPITGQIGYTVFYQSFLQNLAALFGKRNTLLGLQDYLIGEGFNREAPFTTRVFNLLKKQNVYTLFDQLGVIMKGEYFDLNWYRETTILNTLPSRKAKDPLNAMLTILATHSVPDVKIMSPDGSITYYDTGPGSSWKNIVVHYEDGTTKSYDDIFALFQGTMHMLEPFSILNWSRDYIQGNTTLSDVAYVNRLIANLKVIIGFAGQFKIMNQDFKTFLMVLQDRTVFNKWVLDVPVLQASSTVAQFEPQYVKAIHDIFSALGVAGPMILDTETKAWKVFSLWDTTEGVSAYDVQDGGFPIAASVRGIPTTGVSDFTGPEYMMPIIFTWIKLKDDYGTYSKAARFLNRLGSDAIVYPSRLNNLQIDQNPVLAGLNLIGSKDLEMDVPTVSLGIDLATPLDYSAVSRLLATLYGVGQIIDTSNNHNYLIDPSIIGFVGREFSRFSEDSLNYIVNRAPLRQTDGVVSIGFALR